jgi:hypothetical protein
VIEPSVAEAAARRRLFGEDFASVAAGDLVHVPFYEVQATIGAHRVTLALEACSGRVYPDRMPPGVPPSGASGAFGVTTAILAFLAMFLEALLIPPAWLATIVVALTGLALYGVLISGEGRGVA